LGNVQSFLGEILRVEGEGVTWEDLSMEEFVMREENFHEGAAEFSGII